MPFSKENLCDVENEVNMAVSDEQKMMRNKTAVNVLRRYFRFL